MRVDTLASDPKSRVDQWRWDSAMKMGCDPRLADLVRKHQEVDLHALENLIKKGCPPDIAVELLLD